MFFMAWEWNSTNSYQEEYQDQNFKNGILFQSYIQSNQSVINANHLYSKHAMSLYLVTICVIKFCLLKVAFLVFWFFFLLYCVYIFSFCALCGGERKGKE